MTIDDTTGAGRRTDAAVGRRLGTRPRRDGHASARHSTTIEDVARSAGVSVATVSRALRGLPNVAASTRQRVTEAAHELDYLPDPAAARLAAGRTGTVTVAVPSLNGWYFSTVVAGAEAICADAGLEFQVIGVASLAERDRLLAESTRIERRTDGIVFVDIAITDEQAESLVHRRIRFSTIGSRVEGQPSVAIDDERVGEIAADHLVGLGHRHIGLIGGKVDGPMSFDVPRARHRGFVDSLGAHGLALESDATADGDFGVTGGHEAMVALLGADTAPTAVFAMSDEMAFGALMACREHGLVVGRDVSLMGVDDHEFSAVVELTTIHQPVADHGSVAARMLIDDLTAAAAVTDDDEIVDASDGAATSVRPELSLVVRSTTGPPPG